MSTVLYYEIMDQNISLSGGEVSETEDPLLSTGLGSEYTDHYSAYIADDMNDSTEEADDIKLRSFVNNVIYYLDDPNIIFYSNDTIGLSEGPTFGMCGLPAFCPYFANTTTCFCTRMWDCKSCSKALAVAFVCIIVALALAIIISNVLIIWIMLSAKKRNGVMSFLSSIKCSLAAADLLTGFLLIISTFPNHLSSMARTGEELRDSIRQRKNSVESVMFGSILVISISASVYHLFFMSMERFTVIQWPFVMRNRRIWKMRAALASLWAWAVFISSFPVWFPTYFQYSFNVALQMYVPDVRPMDSGEISHGVVYLVLLLFLPYILAAGITFATACVVRVKLERAKILKCNPHRSIYRSSVNEGSRRYQKCCRSLRPEIALLKTTAIIILGFSITLLPLACVVSLFYTNILNCSNYSTPYSSCFYLSLSNSFMNFFIYNWRDLRFRRSVRKIFHFIPTSRRSRQNSTTSFSLATLRSTNGRVHSINNDTQSTVVTNA